jgi:hypothetical protein
VTRENYWAVLLLGRLAEEPGVEAKTELPEKSLRDGGDFRPLLTESDLQLLRDLGFKRRRDNSNRP